MTVGELKEYLEAVPDNWDVHHGGMRYPAVEVSISPDRQQVVIK